MEQILEDYMQLAFDPIYVFLIFGYGNSICREPFSCKYGK